MNGFINVLKPPGMTSHDAVALIRKVYRIKRVGHAGTLDPAAAGVLPVAVGQATRLIEYLSNTARKSYRVEMTFGYQTDTGDDTGKIIAAAKGPVPSPTAVEKTLTLFQGEITQVPPMYSAIKLNGQKLYELARAGISVERAPRAITIYSIDLRQIKENKVLFDVECSKGTYIRSLCFDIGESLHYPAVMSFLVRTKVGPFGLENTVCLEKIIREPEKSLQALDIAIRFLPARKLSTQQSAEFRHGRSVAEPAVAGTLYRLYDDKDVFCGIGKAVSGSLIKPEKVFL